MARTLQLEEVLAGLESDLQQQIAALAPRRIFVHAGVVGWNGGREGGAGGCGVADACGAADDAFGAA